MTHVHGSHDLLFVLFSYFVAVAASYTVLDLAGRIRISTGASRRWWLLFGAAAMGLGIWSMHFVGMLAYQLPVPVPYDLRLVLLSIGVAIAACYIALLIVGRSKVKMSQVFIGGTLLATGIASMHYIGMAAMQVSIHYDRMFVALSLLIALLASVAALWLSFYVRHSGMNQIKGMRLASGLVMGAAIAGMHYTGMAAADFTSLDMPDHHPVGMILDHQWLAYFISGGTLVTLLLCLLMIYISKRFSSKDREIKQKADEIVLINQELRELNEHLEELVAKRTAELANAHDEAIQANRIKSQFLSTMSHELRTPLNAIIGYSEMLMEEAAELDKPEFVADLGKISQSGHHLLALITDILDISKIEAGKTDVHFELCSLAMLLEMILDTIAPLAAVQGNRLETQLADGEIWTDSIKLRQILLNLLSNANKFTHAGTVRLTVVSEEREGRPGYSFSVEDTGIGMTEEQMSHLFEPFMQADTSTTRKYGGTGLGLAISQRLCNLLGGNIEMKSELNRGSKFAFWLPREPVEEEAGQQMKPMSFGL